MDLATVGIDVLGDDGSKDLGIEHIDFTGAASHSKRTLAIVELDVRLILINHENLQRIGLAVVVESDVVKGGVASNVYFGLGPGSDGNYDII